MRRTGFTLVELLVVIAIMAVMAGAVVLTFAGPGSGPTESATRFASRLAAARDEAVLTGRPVSAWVAASGYGFERYQDGQWQPLTARPFAGDDWDEGTRVDGGDDGRARIRFDSLGLPDAPAEVRLALDGRSAAVRVAANGDVTVG